MRRARSCRTQRFNRAADALGLHGADLATLLCLSGRNRVSEYRTGAVVPSERLVRLVEFEAGFRAPSILI